MCVPPMWMVRFVLTISVIWCGLGTTTAQNLPHMLPGVPQHGPQAITILHFSQVGSSPYLNVRGFANPAVRPMILPAPNLPMMILPFGTTPVTPVPVIFGRPNIINPIVFNRPPLNPWMLVAGPAGKPNPREVAEVAGNPWTLNPAITRPAGDLALASPTTGISPTDWQNTRQKPGVSPTTVLTASGVVGYSRGSSPGSHHSASDDSSDNELVYDPATRSFLSSRLGRLIQPGTPGFLPWIWE